MLKQIPLILASLLIFTGCNKSPYKTIGKVEMDKLIHIDTLWKYRDDYLGKTVTIKMDTLSNFSVTGGEFFHGMYEKFDGYKYTISSPKKYSLDSIEGVIYRDKGRLKYFKSQGFDIQDSTLITDYRAYHISILREPKPENIVNSYDKLLIQAHDTLDIILQDSLRGKDYGILKNIGKSTEKWVTGILSNSKLDTTGRRRSGDALYKCRAEYIKLFIIPTGIKYNKTDTLPLIKKR